MARSVCFHGDLPKLCHLLAAELRGQPDDTALLVVSLTSPTHRPKAARGAQEEVAKQLRVLHRLVRLSPYAVVCSIRTTRLNVLDVLVALACDVVRCEQPSAVRVDTSTASEELLTQACKGWLEHTGVNALESGFDFGHLSLPGDVPLVRQLGGFLPHFWMALRHVGIPRASRRTGCDAGHAFGPYFGAKAASLFSAWDAAGAGLVQPAAAEATTLTERVQSGTGAPSALTLVGRCGSTVELRMTSDVLLVRSPSELAEQVAPFLRDAAVKTLRISLEPGAEQSSPFPAAASSHYELYKWHRRWEQLLCSLQAKRLECVALSADLCPPLLELFLAAHERIWRPTDSLQWASKTRSLSYVPGPAALQGCLRQLPLAALRQSLLVGLTPAKAHQLGLVVHEVLPTLLTGPQAPVEQKLKPFLAPSDTSLTSTQACEGDLSRLPESKQESSTGSTTSLPPQSLSIMKTCACGSDPLDWRKPASPRPTPPGSSCSMLGYGLATPPEQFRFSQAEVAEMLGVRPEQTAYWSILTSQHIQTRYLAEMERDLDNPSAVGALRLHAKHLQWATSMLKEAISKACADAGISPSELRHITVCSSTGYCLPGLTAHVMKDKSLGIRPSISRQDIVGMGCHAGLNSLKSAASWAIANPGCYAISCAVEVCSAQYLWGQKTMEELNTVIVNSLFGDGCFAAVLHAAPAQSSAQLPAYFDFPSQWWAQLCDTDALEDMTYEVEESEGKFGFLLSELAPYHVGHGLLTLMQTALEDGIPVHQADHVVTHTGGKTVLECSAVALGLEGGPSESLPWTVQALREYGNQSSASIFFAFHNLAVSGSVQPGDLGMLVTMGPGAGLEMALWRAGERFRTPGTLAPLPLPPLAEESLPGFLQVIDHKYLEEAFARLDKSQRRFRRARSDWVAGRAARVA